MYNVGANPYISMPMYGTGQMPMYGAGQMPMPMNYGPMPVGGAMVPLAGGPLPSLPDEERFISTQTGGVIVDASGNPHATIKPGSFFDRESGKVFGPDAKEITIPSGGTADFFDMIDLNALPRIHKGAVSAPPTKVGGVSGEAPTKVGGVSGSGPVADASSGASALGVDPNLVAKLAQLLASLEQVISALSMLQVSGGGAGGTHPPTKTDGPPAKTGSAPVKTDGPPQFPDHAPPSSTSVGGASGSGDVTQTAVTPPPKTPDVSKSQLQRMLDEVSRLGDQNGSYPPPFSTDVAGVVGSGDVAQASLPPLPSAPAGGSQDQLQDILSLVNRTTLEDRLKNTLEIDTDDVSSGEVS